LRFWFGLVPAFFIIRFLVGVGEAAAFPNENKIVAFWMGHSRRGIGNSMFLMGIGLGGTLTPRFIAWIMQRWGWRMSFYVCGGLGLVLALAWRLYATNRPEEHRRVNSAELALIRASRETAEAPVGLPPAEPPLNPRPSPAAVGSGQGLVKEGINHPVPLLGKEGTKGWSPQGSPAGSRRARPPWKAMLTSASAWGLMLSYFCEGYPNYIFYTWFFLYLVNVRHLTITQGSFWGAAPFLAILLLSPLGGWVSDRAAARFGRRRGRQYTVWLGMALSALLLTAGAHTQANTLAIILLACAAGFNLFATSTWWATCIDLTGNFSGSLSAMMNMWGNLAGALSPILTPYIATRFGWTRALDFAALITFLACLLWIMVNAEGNLEKQTPFSSGAQ
jgi:ACS family glucarate transporter-like MFS transporter